MMSREQIIDRTNGAIGHLYQALAGLYEKKAKYGQGYPIMAEGIVAEIFKLRNEIDDMIGLTDYVEAFGAPMTNETSPALPSMTNGTGSAHTTNQPEAEAIDQRDG